MNDNVRMVEEDEFAEARLIARQLEEDDAEMRRLIRDDRAIEELLPSYPIKAQGAGAYVEGPRTALTPPFHDRDNPATDRAARLPKEAHAYLTAEMVSVAFDALDEMCPDWDGYPVFPDEERLRVAILLAIEEGRLQRAAAEKHESVAKAQR